MERKFESLFIVKKPIIGMIHLAGDSRQDRTKRAMDELTLYQEEGVDGAIIEDYHGDAQDVHNALKESSNKGFTIVRGVNLLSNPYAAFKFADDFGARFIQYDTIQTPVIDIFFYDDQRRKYPDLSMLGGVQFKYTKATGRTLELDIAEAKTRCEAIVTTGKGTGIETPIEKLREFRSILREFPLIVGAGVNLDNVAEQMSVCDGAIIGSYFKPNNDTALPVERRRVKDLMDAIRQLR